MKVLLDIFYSHWWCDPSQNWKPETWTSQTTLATLKTQVTSYTKSVLTTMNSNGVLPDMVQIGNEVNDGNMWPLGRISTKGWTNYITLQNAGYAAVKSVSSSIPVMTHYAGVGTDCITWYTNLFNKGGKSDVLGVSFYEMWHGTIATCASTLTSLYSKFGKDLYVVETAAYWKTSEASYSTNYAQTPQGQYDYLYALTTKLKTITGVKGVFYWGACWAQTSKWLYAPSWTNDDASCRSLFNDSAVATKAIDAIKNAGGMTVMGVDISEAIKAENAGVDFTD